MPQSYNEGQRLKGSDGQIYVVHGGTPVLESSVAAGPQTFGTPDPTQPLKVPEAQAKIDNTTTDTATARAKLPFVAPLDAAALKEATAKAEYAKQLAAATAAEAAAKADLAKSQANMGAQPQSPMLQKQAQARGAMNLLDNLDKQEALWREKYVNNGVLDSIGRIFPSPTNRNFDQYSKNELVSGKAFLRVPGEGSSSDRDVTNYTDLLPGSDSYDATNINRFQNLRNSANKVLLDAGMPARQSNVLTPDGKVYVGPRDAQGRPVAFPPGLGGSGAPPPERPDGSAPVAGGTSGGNVMSLSQDGYTSSLVDPAKVVRTSFADLIKSNPTDGQARAWGALHGYDMSSYLAARRKNSGIVPTLGKSVVRKPLSVSDSVVNTIAQSPLGAGAITAGQAVGGNWLDELAPDPEKARGVMALSRATHPTAALVGDLAGSALAAYGGELGVAGAGARLGIKGAARFAPLVADTLYGAASGAGQADPGNRVLGAVVGAGLGAAGGAGGRGIAKGFGNTARGIQDASVQFLNKRGIPLTAGQAIGPSGMFGRAVKGLEDRMTGFSGIGDLVNARRTEGLRGFNDAAFAEGGAPIGFRPTAIGEQGIDAFKDASGRAYRGAVDGVSVTPDAQFGQDVGSALTRGSGLPRVGPEFNSLVNSDIAPHFSAPAGTIDGPQIQDILQNTRGAPFGTDAMGTKANAALNDIGGAVSDLASRQAPDVIPRLQAANTAYRNLNILADATGRGINTDGIFTPAQLGLSARANVTKFGGKLAAASEDRPFFDLQRHAQDILPSKVPDSGTAGRLALLAIPTLAGGAGGGGVGYAAGDTSKGAGIGSTAGLVATLALAGGGSRIGQRIITSALLDRPDFAVQIGNKVYKRAGMFGAPGVAGMLQLNNTQ